MTFTRTRHAPLRTREPSHLPATFNDAHPVTSGPRGATVYDVPRPAPTYPEGQVQPPLPRTTPRGAKR